MQDIHKCGLCEKKIEQYMEPFNRFEIDESLSADICSECIRKFVKWQQKNLASLFPVKTAKRFLKKQ